MLLLVGAVAGVVVANRSCWRFTTGASAGNGAKTRSATANLHKPYKTTGSPKCQFLMRLNDYDPDNVIGYFGLASGLGGPGVASSADFIGFGIASGDSGTNFIAACCKSGSGRTVLDTGVALDGNFHVFEFRVRSTTRVEFYVDKQYRGAIETNVPTVDLQRVLSLVNVEAAANTFDIDSFAVFSTRSPS